MNDNLHGRFIQKVFFLLLIPGTCIALTGCSSNMVTAGKDVIQIEGG